MNSRAKKIALLNAGDRNALRWIVEMPRALNKLNEEGPHVRHLNKLLRLGLIVIGPSMTRLMVTEAGHDVYTEIGIEWESRWMDEQD